VPAGEEGSRRSGASGAAGSSAGLAPAVLVEVRAALEAGATPAAALAVARDGALAAVARELRLGRGLGELAVTVDTGDPRADLLIRGLAVAERTGAGAAEAVEQVLRAAAEAAAVTRALEVRTTQARGTAVVLAFLPLVVWALMVALDPSTLTLYTTPLGVGSAVAAIALILLARWLCRRIIARVERTPERVDPLRGPEPPRDPVRAVALALPVAMVLGIGAGPLLGVLGALAAAAGGLRRRGTPPADLRGGGTPETAELLAIALSAGLPPVGAVTEVAALGPPAARAGLGDAARRLGGGWALEEAFEGTHLEQVGAVLAATARWGAPAEPALRRLADEVRADRRAAGEAAAERTQLALLFPTTLLTLPAFVLGVVPPVLWTAFAG
jgi:Flp pilus assembly protein TadB